MKDTATLRSSGFAAVPFWVIDKLGTTSSSVLFVYCALCRLSNFDTRVTTSDWAAVVDATGLSRATVMSAMSKLRDVGAVVRRGSDLLLPKDSPDFQTDTDLQSSISDPIVQVSGPTPYSHSISDKDPQKAFSSPVKAGYTTDFEGLWKTYPRRENKMGAFKAYNASLRRGIEHTTLLEAATNYAALVRAEKRENSMILHLATFVGPNERWRDYIGEADVWVPEGSALRAAQAWDSFFDEGVWADRGGTIHNEMPPQNTAPKHPDGNLTAADGRRYTVTGTTRTWVT